MPDGRHNSWKRARLLLWMRILSILAFALAIGGAGIWYANQHHRVAHTTRPPLSATPSATPLPTVLSAIARASLVSTATTRISHLSHQATAHGITVRVAAVGGATPVLHIVYGPLPAWEDVSGAGDATLTDAWGRAVPMSSAAQGGCGNLAVYPVTCYTVQHFTRVTSGTPLILSIKELLVNEHRSPKQHWVIGPWTMTLRMP